MEKDSVFKVEIDYQDRYNADYEARWTEVTDVRPMAVSSKCPHCGVYSSFAIDQWVHRSPGWRFDLLCHCPQCEQSIFVQGQHFEPEPHQGLVAFSSVESIFPPIVREDISNYVPEPYRGDHIEAAKVLSASPKASAALSRRCLQLLLHEHLGIKKRSLAKEIDELIASKQLPSHLREAVDAIRNVGNFAAHPVKDSDTGQIVEVEPGEAEWLLDVLEALYDFYFVQPRILDEKRKLLNDKLSIAGKPPMKGPEP